ncbi:hypothetical protein MTR_7g015730 [Medicago truncatula]|uniref:Uncharacterized protein n=1 Tax=Medicago truncatula TaxID=3880 RepID=A0A072TW43_MEDTR|nr:hypothetical protein MTR_7g015730 [Medicago truncatula]
MRCWGSVSSKGGAENKMKRIWALGEARRVWAWIRPVQTGLKVEPSRILLLGEEHDSLF